MNETPIKLAFLVYDSRSGSTLLAREITTHLRNVFVTPEIGFDSLLAIGQRGVNRLGWRGVLDRLYKGYDFRHFDIPIEEAISLVHHSDGSPLPISTAIRRLMSAYTKRHIDSEPQWIVIKNGSHLRYWRTLNTLFGNELRLIHIIRDPRAVINSKLRTRRPYRQQETMAWGGALLAALRWRRYVHQAEQAKLEGVALYSLHYEDLLGVPGDVLSKIAQFLEVSVRSVPIEKAYTVPETESLIHQRVIGNNFDTARENAWQQELSVYDRFQIEALCAEPMHRLGYSIQSRHRLLRMVAAYCIGLPAAILGIVKHALVERRPLR